MAYVITNKTYTLSGDPEGLVPEQTLVIKYELSNGASTKILYQQFEGIAPGETPDSATLTDTDTEVLAIANA